MLAACIHLMRGTPYIYQGEEIGMTNPGYDSIDQYRDVESLNHYRILLEKGKTEDEALEILSARSRDNGRSPMQWTEETHGGFSEAAPWIPMAGNFTGINVASARKEKDSILAFYRELIRLRKEMPIIAEGDIHFLEEENPDVLAYERTWKNERLVVLCNFRGHSASLGKGCVLDYEKDGYRKVIGNYRGTESGLRPYEAAAYHKVG